MRRTAVVCLLVVATLAGKIVVGQAPAKVPGAASSSASLAAIAEPAWVTRSNAYTRRLLDVQFNHSPEGGSEQGLAKYDDAITDPTRAAEIVQRKQLQAILTEIKADEKKEKSKDLREDMEILQRAFNLQFREDDYQLDHRVTFVDASQAVFAGVRTLLNDQVAAERRPAAAIRLRKYAGTEPGYKPLTELLKQRVMEQMAKPGVLYPSSTEMESQLALDQNYIDGMRQLFVKYDLSGWQGALDKLTEELADYNTWIRGTVMPKARSSFQLAPEEYALRLEHYGVTIDPAQLALMAHAEFAQCQAEMAPLALEVAKQHGWQLTDYRDVIRELKNTQITGDAIVPFYTARLNAIEDIIVAQKLVTLPERPAIIRLATAAETAQQPAPHMVPPPLLHNTGEKGEFVLPLNAASTAEGAGDTYDDFTFDAVAWAMTAHEARPGHELQFASMLEHGVSLARAMYAFNSTNVEGWGLYAEWMMQPYEPADGKLLTLQLRLLRAARAYLDSELQSGKITQADAYKVLENDVVLSHGMAKEEVERFVFRMPAQANSYFYGYTKLMQLRKDTEAALGPKFNQQRYHDFLLAQGLLPPDLMRQAVMEEFVPSQK